jgi:hypothetical protein
MGRPVSATTVRRWWRAASLSQVNKTEAKRLHLEKLAGIRKAKQNKASAPVGEQFDSERLRKAILYLKEHPKR